MSLELFSLSLSLCSFLQLHRASLTCQRCIHARGHGPANGSSALRLIALICLSAQQSRWPRFKRDAKWSRRRHDEQRSHAVLPSVFFFECECGVTMFAQCHRLSVKRGEKITIQIKFILCSFFEEEFKIEW